MLRIGESIFGKRLWKILLFLEVATYLKH
jgi:hypothetical protein